MKIKLLLVGRTIEKPCAELLLKYTDRIKKYTDFSITEIADTKASSSRELSTKEGVLLKKEFAKADFITLLDEAGKAFSSVEFASYIQQKQSENRKRLVFVAGGAYGFSEEIYSLSQDKLSLSQMTFPHQLVRVIFAEQLYRAFTILNHEPYHHI